MKTDIKEANLKHLELEITEFKIPRSFFDWRYWIGYRVFNFKYIIPAGSNFDIIGCKCFPKRSQQRYNETDLEVMVNLVVLKDNSGKKSEQNYEMDLKLPVGTTVLVIRQYFNRNDNGDTRVLIG